MKVGLLMRWYTMKAQHQVAIMRTNLRRRRALLRTSARPRWAATLALASAKGASGRCPRFLEAMAAKAAVASPFTRATHSRLGSDLCQPHHDACSPLWPC